MPVFAALAGGKVALYHPLQAPAGGKVLYRPLEQFFWCRHFFLRKNSGNNLKKSKFYTVSISNVIISQLIHFSLSKFKPALPRLENRHFKKKTSDVKLQTQSLYK
jgi:hypothetical protein